MGYKVLYIQQSEKLSLYLDNCKIQSEKGELLFPITDLQMLVIDNYKLVLSVQLLNKLAENNVSIVCCGMDHLPASYILPYNGYYAQSGMLSEQIKWKQEIKDELRKEIVTAKIKNQAIILKKNNKSEAVIAHLLEYANEVKINDETNREGLAAKMYFREMFGNNFIRFDDDMVNAGLNYGYAIFRSLITSLIVAKGLLPNFGLFHVGKTNKFNLSDDLIEVYRPIVDDYVLNHLMNVEILTKEHRENLIRLTTGKIMFNGKMQTIHNSIDLYIEAILKCIRENDTKYFDYPIINNKNDL